MDKFSGNRLALGSVTPATQASAVDQTSLPPVSPYPDVVIVSLAEDYAVDHLEWCAQAKDAGLAFTSLVVENADGSDLPGKIAALHTGAKLGPGTQVIIKMHGALNHGRHWLGTSTQTFIDTGELIDLLRCPPGSRKPVSQWKGLIHLVSCHIATAGERMRDRLGYCVFYGGHETTLADDGVETVKEMMRIFGLSRGQGQQQDGSAINAASLFPHLAGFTGEPITLTGNGRCELVHPFDADTLNFATEKEETERWMRLLFSRLDHGTLAEVKQILDVMGPKLVNRLHSTGTTSLHSAAGSRSDKTEQITVLLHAGADIDATDDEGSTALMDACRYGRSKVLAFLLKHGADTEIINTNGDKVIDFATELGRRHVVMDLVTAGADINRPDRQGISPFLNACIKKNADLAEIMLTVGKPDLAARSPRGQTALHLACESFAPELVEFMLQQGADPLMPDSEGVTPFEQALVRGDRAVLRALAEHLFDEVNEADITAFFARAKQTSARAVVEKVIKIPGD